RTRPPRRPLRDAGHGDRHAPHPGRPGPPGLMGPLPKGRHHLTRDEVEQTQRLRLAVAMADVLAERGYAGTPVAAVLERAGVSRQTFYELYANKLECFLDALDLVGAVLISRLGEALAGDGDPVERAA